MIPSEVNPDCFEFFESIQQFLQTNLWNLITSIMFHTVLSYPHYQILPTEIEFNILQVLHIFQAIIQIFKRRISNLRTPRQYSYSSLSFQLILTWLKASRNSQGQDISSSLDWRTSWLYYQFSQTYHQIYQDPNKLIYCCKLKFKVLRNGSLCKLLLRA